MTKAGNDAIFGFSGPFTKALAVFLIMAAVALFFFSLPADADEWLRSRSLAMKLFLFPILLSSAWFGVPGAMATTSIVTGINGGYILLEWPGETAVQVGRMGEIGVFWLVGALAASFFEQQKRYVRELEEANENTLVALALALDVREHDTALHSHRVADYTQRLARELGIADPAALATIRKGALLHDIGKIGIPDRVLLKKGPLSGDEWAVMRTHPEVGYGMIREIRALRHPAEIVRAHHERYDGTGYPMGLRGTEIPLGARLFAVIDVYDALTTMRSYHDPKTHTRALEIVREGARTHFDPAVVAAFERVPPDDWERIAAANRTAPLQGTGA